MSGITVARVFELESQCGLISLPHFVAGEHNQIQVFYVGRLPEHVR